MYVHWLPTENPTFIIPDDIQLTQTQSETLSLFGQQQGVLFSLNNNGSLTKPEAKKFKIKTIEGFVCIKNNSFIIKNGIIQFYYTSSVDTKINITFFVKDMSTNSSIRL